jgi:ribosome-associated protein
MPDLEILQQELNFKAVKSSGPGGQHVNKTASKVVAQFDVNSSQALNENEKALLLTKLSSRLSKEGILIMESSSTRSQHKNKELVVERLLEVVIEGLKKPKFRKKTKPSKASKLKRLREKKIRSERKDQRQKPDL